VYTLAEIEKDFGRYLTAPEIENAQHRRFSHELTAEELRAVKRIWPHVQLEFKLTQGGIPWRVEGS